LEDCNWERSQNELELGGLQFWGRFELLAWRILKKGWLGGLAWRTISFSQRPPGCLLSKRSLEVKENGLVNEVLVR